MSPTDRKTQPGDFGLSCTFDGVSLGGVPLLRKTLAGLAPRSVTEIAVLIKNAYGERGITLPYAGLDVIARALNQGYIGRAMIATIQLRLPDSGEFGMTVSGCQHDKLEIKA